MDVWGDDPWADSNTTSSDVGRKQDPVPLPAANATFGGFEDDAGWGDFEQSANGARGNGGWGEGVAQVKEVDIGHDLDLVSTASSLPQVEYEGYTNEVEDVAEPNDELHFFYEDVPQRHAVEENGSTAQDRLEEDEDSQSGSTVMPNAILPRSEETAVTTEVEHGESKENRPVQEKPTRPMSSSSEATDISESRTVSSTRTSLEQGLPDSQVGEDNIWEAKAEVTDILQEDEESDEAEIKDARDTTLEADTQTTKPRSASGPNFEADLKLLNQLFKPSKVESKLEATVEDLIDSIPARKAWYRITRPQTLRGFRSGDSDDSYTRVTWAVSGIRKDTIKIVSRWTSEDRIHGRTVLGAIPKASFGWDESSNTSTTNTMTRRSVGNIQPVPINPRFSHSRQPSLVANAATAPSPVAQFGWSTSPIFPIAASKGEVSVTASPIGANGDNPWRRSMQTRPSSVQISSGSLDAVFAAEQKVTTSLQQFQPSTAPSRDAPTKVDLVINTALAVAHDNTAAGDDDDDWGEMVQSPRLPDSPKLSAITNGPHVEISTHSILQPEKIRNLSPISPVTSKQVIPEGQLSPARRAAFHAARVTRTLSSQHADGGSSPQDKEAQFEDFTKVNLRKTSPSVVLEQPEHGTEARHVTVRKTSDVRASIHDPSFVTSTTTKSAPYPIVAHNHPDGDVAATAPTEPGTHTSAIMDDQWSLFETFESTPTSFVVEKPTQSRRPALVPQDVQKVENFLAQLPNLSYMFE
jgi:hypothetical protein